MMPNAFFLSNHVYATLIALGVVAGSETNVLTRYETNEAGVELTNSIPLEIVTQVTSLRYTNLATNAIFAYLTSETNYLTNYVREGEAVPVYVTNFGIVSMLTMLAPIVATNVSTNVVITTNLVALPLR